MDETRIREIFREELAKKATQQILYPLDEASRTIINENIPVFQVFTSGSPTTNGHIVVKINGQFYKIMTTA